MKKNKFVNLIAFLLGIYLMVRAYFFYEGGNKSLALVYLCIGVFAIVAQLIVNYIKTKKEE